jgi:DNA-binding transcriptional LysR family regulator
MASLEKEFKQSLFYDTYPLALTPAGETVFNKANELLTVQASMLSELAVLPNLAPERFLIQDMLHLESLYAGISKAMASTKRAFQQVTFEYVKNSSGQSLLEMLEAKQMSAVFMLTIDHEPYKAARTPESIEGILIPSFHGELSFGLRKDSPLLQTKDLITLKDLSKMKFMLPAKRHYEQFKDDFIEMCKGEGFYPYLEMVSADNLLDFYSRDPGDNVFLITKLYDGRHTAFDEHIRGSLTVITPRDDLYYVNTTMLVRKEPHSEAFQYFLDEVVRLEKPWLQNDSG